MIRMYESVNNVIQIRHMLTLDFGADMVNDVVDNPIDFFGLYPFAIEPKEK